MSSEDLPTEVIDSDELSDLPPFEDEEPAESLDDVQDEEPVESETEEATESSEGADESPEDEESGPDLSQFPEEIRDSVRAYAQSLGDRRVGKLESSYTQKLQEAADLKKAIEEYDRVLKENPEAVLAEVQKMVAASEKPKGPPDPGPMPEPEDGFIDAKAFADWIAKRDAYRDWQTEQRLAAVKQETEKNLQPLLQRQAQALAAERERLIQQQTEADDDVFSEMKALASEAKSDPMKAWSLIKEVVALRREVAGKTKARQQKALEQIRGSEEKPGLPGTGTRRPAPRPTGDEIADLAAEVEADGFEFPEGH